MRFVLENMVQKGFKKKQPTRVTSSYKLEPPLLYRLGRTAVDPNGFLFFGQGSESRQGLLG